MKLHTKNLIRMLGVIAITVGIGSQQSVEAGYRYQVRDLDWRLAERFHLNRDEVRKYLDDYDMEFCSSQNYSYDNYSDQYIPSSRIEDVQHNRHLAFIEQKMEEDVRGGYLAPEKKNAIMNKLEEVIPRQPKSNEFAKMSFLEQRDEINEFKAEMEPFMRTQGMTLAQLRAITGKGNKHLMGIYY